MAKATKKAPAKRAYTRRAKAAPAEPRIVAAAATMVGSNFSGNAGAARELERRMHNALKRAQDQGKTVEEQKAAVRVAVQRYRAGEPE